MAVYIPDNDGGQNQYLSLITSAAIDHATEAAATYCGLSGIGGVATSGTGTREVDISAGTAYFFRRPYSFSGATVTHDAATTARFDTIRVNTAGTISIQKGTVDGDPPREPTPAALTSYQTIATVLVLPENTSGGIPTAQILDRSTRWSTLPTQFTSGTAAPVNDTGGVQGDVYLHETTGTLYKMDSNRDWQIILQSGSGVYVAEASWEPSDGVPDYVLPGTKIMQRQY